MAYRCALFCAHHHHEHGADRLGRFIGDAYGCSDVSLVIGLRAHRRRVEHCRTCNTSAMSSPARHKGGRVRQLDPDKNGQPRSGTHADYERSLTNHDATQHVDS